MSFTQQYEREHHKMVNTIQQPSHIAQIQGLGHHSQRMPTDVYGAMALHGNPSHDEQFTKRSLRENLAITHNVHNNPHHPHREIVPSVIGGINHPCPVGEKAQAWGSVSVAQNPPCVSSSPTYGAFHMDEHRQHGAHHFSGLHHEHNLKRQGLDSFRRRERMHHREEEDFYKMGRM